MKIVNKMAGASARAVQEMATDYAAFINLDMDSEVKM